MKSHVVYASSALLGNEMTFIKLKKKKKKKKNNLAYGLYKFNKMFYFQGNYFIDILRSTSSVTHKLLKCPKTLFLQNLHIFL